MTDTHTELTQRRPIDEWVWLGWFWAIVGVSETLLVLVFRSGLATSSWLLLTCGALIVAAAAAPAALMRIFPSACARRAYLPPLASLVTLCLPIATIPFERVGGVLIVFFACGAFALGLARSIRISRVKLLLLLAGAPLTAWYLFLAVNNQGIATIFTPEQAMLGMLNRDTTFHTAIAGMIQNFGVTSLGMDGLIPFAYHTGSHHWFAGIGVATGSTALASYAVAISVVAVPSLIMATSFATHIFGACRLGAAGALIRVLLMLFIVDAISKAWTSYYISESYTLGLTAMLLLLPLLRDAIQRRKLPTQETLFRTGVLVLAIVPLAWLKLSIGVLWAVAVGWFAIRGEASVWRRITYLMFVGVISLIALRLFAPSTSDFASKSQSLIVPFFFFRLFPLAEALSSLVVPVCYLLVSALEYRGMGGWRQALQQRKLMFAEIVLVVTVVGSLPAILGIPQDSAVWYFLNVGQWFALPALAAALSTADFGDLKRPLFATKAGLVATTLGLYVLAAQVGTALTPRFTYIARDTIRALDERSEGRVLAGRSPGLAFRSWVKQEQTVFGKSVRDALAEAPGTRLRNIVAKAANGRRDRIAVFIPPSNEEFWRLVPSCRTIYHVQASLTGYPSLLGAPPVTHNCEPDAYQEHYGPTPHSRELSDEGLCAHAKYRGIDTVIVVENIHDDNAARIVDCMRR